MDPRLDGIYLPKAFRANRNRRTSVSPWRREGSRLAMIPFLFLFSFSLFLFLALSPRLSADEGEGLSIEIQRNRERTRTKKRERNIVFFKHVIRRVITHYALVDRVYLPCTVEATNNLDRNGEQSAIHCVLPRSITTTANGSSNLFSAQVATSTTPLSVGIPAR